MLHRKLKKSEDTQASLKAELSSVKVDLELLKRLRAKHKSSLHHAASGGAAAALGVLYSHYPDLDLDKIKSGMRCRTMEEANALCLRFDPLVEELVKMAGVVPHSSSSDVEAGGSSDNIEEGLD